MTDIRFENVSKSFGGASVVEGLDLAIESREFFTFVGDSGSGKSTILNLVSGLESLTTGAILFDGEDIGGLSPGERDVAMVFQSYALYPHMTVFENMAFPLRVRGEAKGVIEEEVRRAADSLGLSGLLDRRPGALSGGQRQRVALGRAIVRKPRVFLMDEPLSNLDARLRAQTRGELKKLHERLAVTTIYVTHDQEEAMSLSGRIAVLSRGRIQQVGAPMDVYEKPINLYVAGFIGSPAMNFVGGQLLAASSAMGAMLGGVKPEDAVIGARPADITVTAKDAGHCLPVEVELIEPVGRETWVDGVWKGIKIKGRAAEGEILTEGGAAYFTLPSDKIHIFDKTTGQRTGGGS